MPAPPCARFRRQRGGRTKREVIGRSCKRGDVIRGLESAWCVKAGPASRQPGLQLWLAGPLESIQMDGDQASSGQRALARSRGVNPKTIFQMAPTADSSGETHDARRKEHSQECASGWSDLVARMTPLYALLACHGHPGFVGRRFHPFPGAGSRPTRPGARPGAGGAWERPAMTVGQLAPASPRGGKSRC